MPVLTFARYILELSLMEYDLNVETSESMLATAVMYIALKVGTKETRVFILLPYTVAIHVVQMLFRKNCQKSPSFGNLRNKVTKSQCMSCIDAIRIYMIS